MVLYREESQIAECNRVLCEAVEAELKTQAESLGMSVEYKKGVYSGIEPKLHISGEMVTVQGQRRRCGRYDWRKVAGVDIRVTPFRRDSQLKISTYKLAGGAGDKEISAKVKKVLARVREVAAASDTVRESERLQQEKRDRCRKVVETFQQRAKVFGLCVSVGSGNEPKLVARGEKEVEQLLRLLEERAAT